MERATRPTLLPNLMARRVLGTPTHQFRARPQVVVTVILRLMEIPLGHPRTPTLAAIQGSPRVQVDIIVHQLFLLLYLQGQQRGRMWGWVLLEW